MILLLAIFAGLIAGIIRALVNRRKLAAPNLRFIWIVPLAFLPQLFAFQIPATRASIPDQWIPAALIGSQLFLLIFTAANLRQPGFWLLGAGLLLNLVVITLNGGWMPISPETVKRLAPNAPSGAWEIGKRLGLTKDKVIQSSDTHLWLLSDRFVFPDWFNYHIAFSIGDVLIALGAIWFFWSLGGPSNPDQIRGA